MTKDKHRLSPADVETMAKPYYGARFWNALLKDMGKFSERGPFSPGAATRWKKNGLSGHARIVALKAIAAKRETLRQEMKRADKMLNAFLKTIDET